MKKAFCNMLALLFVICLSLFSVHAEMTTEEKLIEYAKKIYHFDPELYVYQELFTHQNSERETDWVLIYSLGVGEEPWYVCGVFNHRVILASEKWELFSLGMGLYDAKADTFYDLTKINDYSKYDGLSEAIDIYGKGKLLGDIDNDNEVSILDCTELQRCEVGLSEYPASDSVMFYYEKYENIDTPLNYYSDFNRDGERNILDVTCIQRYLAGMTYPIG